MYVRACGVDVYARVRVCAKFQVGPKGVLVCMCKAYVCLCVRACTCACVGAVAR